MQADEVHREKTPKNSDLVSNQNTLDPDILQPFVHVRETIGTRRILEWDDYELGAICS
jgi:hypothetical protein